MHEIPDAALAALQDRFGDQLLLDAESRDGRTPTPTWLPRQPPAAVVVVRDVADVQDAVRLCAPHRIPIVPFGGGTSLEGQVNAPLGGVSLDLSRMNRVLDVSVRDQLAVVEPGVKYTALNARLREQGLFFPVDPGAAATLGGMASTRASGTNALRYGTMRENVVSLEVVLADGRRIRTGCRARKSSTGYDLTRLFVGAEGTLGILTEIVVKLYPRPTGFAGGYCSFPDVATAVGMVADALALGLLPGKIEFLDEVAVEACNAYSGLNLDVGPTLFVEFHGSHVPPEAEAFRNLAEARGAACGWTTDAQALEDLWTARHDAWWAIHAHFEGLRGVTTDTCVPISRLAHCVAEARGALAEMRLRGAIVGHVGDGNFHVLLMLDLADEDEVTRAKCFVARMSALAIEQGGSCSGEHGVGQGKRDAVREEHGEALDVMRLIKHALDPMGSMNPGKLF
jgi:D-lactate dehydrogenase (cytochrome)